MTRDLSPSNGGAGNIGNWIVGQLIMVSLALALVWAAGLRFLWRSGRPLWRALAWAYGLLFVFFALTTGAKIYYLAGGTSTCSPPARLPSSGGSLPGRAGCAG
jgi:hypothetical protein